MKPYTPLELRKQLLEAVACLPANAPTKAVEGALDPLASQWNFEKKKGYIWDLDTNDDEKITPFLVACDKNQISCLYYIEKAIKSNDDACLWGLPQFQTSEKGNGNIPMHHAALSGCTKAIDVSHTLCMAWCREFPLPRTKEDEAKDEFSNLKFLLSSVNSHGDNPLMMACATGHISCVRYWTTCIVKAARKKKNAFKTETERIMDLKKPYVAKNNSGDTALSLAAGHGHFDVVDFLVNDQKLFFQEEGTALVNATTDEINKCQSTIDRINEMLKNNDATNVASDACTVRDKIRRCLVMMQVASSRAVTFKNKCPADNEAYGNQSTSQHLQSDRCKKNRKKTKSKSSKAKKLREIHDKRNACEEGTLHGNKKEQKKGNADAENVEMKINAIKSAVSSIESDELTVDDKRVGSATNKNQLNSAVEDLSKRLVQKERKLSSCSVSGKPNAPKQQHMEDIFEDEDLIKIIHSPASLLKDSQPVEKHSLQKMERKPKTNLASGTEVAGTHTGAWNKPLFGIGQDALLPHNPSLENQNKQNSPFVTLEDGTVINANEWKNCQDASPHNTPIVEKTAKPVEEMLRERYREGLGEAWATNDHSIDAVMDSLCLDASMLLFSPHGMAMQLSPAQLEAVSGILYKQMDAVKEAREIQNRLRKPNKAL
mmetsp:Transcript_21294/g.32786  ORF Transcript_21294/g.32786 Transcript_21294/m.32786 type:complete len:658 (-) Transcript_21294:32-2005(-)|eukprot:CAMPEP_0195299162 /NCGR_PEP_ID=MMETSP0707-20130614/24950_1 /TAXON_ID=33640 /ORGANISM="Asterionellopsis glacialis, Strain CCMP134" /LENGTH=657 /DNA_ID=CAMNT_0040361469 /DNA_START=67 /DNA_END=2040 /DNA_ORIENTATION=+